MNTPTLLDQTSLTLFALNPQTRTQPHINMKIQPYTLKSDETAMHNVREMTLTSSPPNSSCGVIHHSPALIFSARGYNGNFYHEINDIFIPLFITLNSLFTNQLDVILVVVDGPTWWYKKYDELLSTFSPNHKIIDPNNLTTSHCFPSATVGLIKHGPMTIDPKLMLQYHKTKTLLDFHAFLESAYIKKDTPLIYPGDKGKPLLTLVSRKGGSRKLLNEEEVIKLAEDIGFNVHVLDHSKGLTVPDVYRLVHSSHVLLGVHGAGLTNMMFLRQGSVLVQVVPLGLDSFSTICYGKPSEPLGLEYVEYKIEANESSMAWEHGADSLMIKDPEAYIDGKWENLRIYLGEQNVKINLIRFRKCLMEAYEKAKIFMNSTS
jgi:protein O-GlcNAc transferase